MAPFGHGSVCCLSPFAGFDLHCVAELTVQLAKFSALADGKLAMSSPHCCTEDTFSDGDGRRSH